MEFSSKDLWHVLKICALLALLKSVIWEGHHLRVIFKETLVGFWQINSVLVPFTVLLNQLNWCQRFWKTFCLLVYHRYFSAWATDQPARHSGVPELYPADVGPSPSFRRKYPELRTVLQWFPLPRECTHYNISPSGNLPAWRSHPRYCLSY